MKMLIRIWSILICGFVQAQNLPALNVSLIPDSLKRNANSVTRQEHIIIDVLEKGKATITTHREITVLNPAGEEQLLFNDYEDNFRKLDAVAITVYDANGNFLEKYAKKQLEQVRHDDGFSLVNDGKIFYLKIPVSQYPVTVVYHAVVKLIGFLDFQDIAVTRVEESIENLQYTIHTPETNPIRYKNINCNFIPGIQKELNGNTYIWKVQNQKAVPYEKNSSARNALPRIILTPTYFEMDGYKGEFSNWLLYGNWYHQLCSGSNDLKEKEKETILEIAGKATTDLEKIKLLYNYLQQNFRYVSIQLGIGGYKPFPASFVQKNKYGDCKALSNYMQNILQVAGITSFQALINAGNKQQAVEADFPNHSFNHVILCVPNNKDTVWLECTSAVAPFGVLGAFTENRNALLITPTGGRLVATPASRAVDNMIATKNQIIIDADFSAKASFLFRYSGEFARDMNQHFWNLNTNEQQSYLLQQMGFKPFENSVIEKGLSAETSITKMQLDYAKIQDFNAGTKYFLSPHLFTVWKSPLPLQKERTTDYFFNHPFIETDTSVYRLPSGYTIDNAMPSVQYKCTNAAFETKLLFDNNAKTITVITTLQLYRHRIPANLYAETKAFFDQVIAACNQKIVVKKE